MSNNHSLLEVENGPFDLKLARRDNVIEMTVIGSKGDIVTQLDFNVARIESVISQLVSLRGV